MKVWVKDFSIDMEIKNSGMELTVYSPDGATQRGDLYITKSGLTWCRGKTKKENGTKVSWEEFIAWAEGK